MLDYTTNSKKNQEKRYQRHQFLLTFFDKSNRYEVKEVNNFILVRYFNKSVNRWEVSIYSKENWLKVQNWKQKMKLNQASLL